MPVYAFFVLLRFLPLQWIDFECKMFFLPLQRIDVEGKTLAAIVNTVLLQRPGSPGVGTADAVVLSVEEEVCRLGTRHLVAVSLVFLYALVEVRDVIAQR